jgi:hypothetical protein
MLGGIGDCADASKGAIMDTVSDTPGPKGRDIEQYLLLNRESYRRDFLPIYS